MKVLFDFLFFFFLILQFGCKSSGVQSKETPRDSYLNIYTASQQEQTLKQATYQRIDSLIQVLFESEYTSCHFHNRYDSKHDYSKMHHPILDELAFYSGYSIRYERYIYSKVTNNHQHKGSSGEQWKNCIMLFPKKDCGGINYSRRLDFLASVVLDTTSFQKCEEMLSRVSGILDEPCRSTILTMQNDYRWRARVYQNIIRQTKNLFLKNESFDDELYKVMYCLKDSLSSRFAYDYIMNHEDLPGGIDDIIEDRFKDWDKGNGYTRYQGAAILFSETEVKRLVKRVETIKNNIDCVWCDEMIRRLNLRFE